MRPGLRPIRRRLGALGAGHLLAEVLRRQVRVPHGHRLDGMTEDLLQGGLQSQDTPGQVDSIPCQIE